MGMNWVVILQDETYNQWRYPSWPIRRICCNSGQWAVNVSYRRTRSFWQSQLCLSTECSILSMAVHCSDGTSSDLFTSRQVRYVGA